MEHFHADVGVRAKIREQFTIPLMRPLKATRLFLFRMFSVD